MSNSDSLTFSENAENIAPVFSTEQTSAEQTASYEPCLACQSLNPIGAAICHDCGTNIPQLKQKFLERLQTQQQQVMKLREVCGHDRAISLLKQMIAVTHPDFSRYRDWAKANLPTFQKERRDLRAYVDGLLFQAKEAMAAQKYARVQEILEEVPRLMVDENMKKMYADAGECITEVDSLVREIRNAIVTKQYNTLLSCVQRYAELKANDPEALSLHQKIEKLTTQTTADGIILRLIPSGKFYMGSHDSDEFMRNNEHPQHRIQVTKPLFVGIYPVTQEHFSSLLGFNPSTSTDVQNCPVDSVTWYSAIEFCNKLSEKEGFSPYYSLNATKRRASQAIEEAGVNILGGNGFRLPTEAEWEYACRAGSITPWCFGDLVLDVTHYAWYYDNAQLETHIVGEKKPNAWGLYDMHGNVMEWCYDWYNEFYYQQEQREDDPTGPMDGVARVLRGGAWQFGAEATRSAYRNSANPNSTSNVIGFRVIRDAENDDVFH
ncbi:MAG: formylglycine-generating enzyme family protein [Planctomycetaceae bacterium]|jgi:formylglycine-generating enzyme required for sulfatase activity/ribosomal protein L40E|nr:formylglycine-generating enzyme family protein [Planctomycetaceae bacterium]